MRNAFIALTLILFTGMVFAAPDTRNSPISLSAEHMTAQTTDNRTVTQLRGNVVAANIDYTLTTESADIYSSGNDELQQIVCTGNVNFKSISMNMLAVSDRAVLDHPKQLLTLTGNVKVHQPDRVLQTERIVINYETGEVVAGGTDGGRVNIIINSLDGVN